MKYILDPGRGEKVALFLEEKRALMALDAAISAAPRNSAWFPALYLRQHSKWEQRRAGKWEPAERRIIPAKVLIEGEGTD